MTAPTGFLGTGDLYMDRLTAAGASTGLKRVGNATMLSIKAESENKTLIGRGKNNHGMVLGSVDIQQPGLIEVEINEYDKETLAMIFLGEASVVQVTGASVTDEAVTAIAGAFVNLAYHGVSNVVVQDVTDTTTYVEGTDYNINYEVGMLETIVGGGITDADVLHVDYDYETADYDKIVGATQPTVKVALFLDGKNLNNGKECFVNVWEATLSPDAAVDFLAEDFVATKFTGSMIKPAAKDSPFTVENKL